MLPKYSILFICWILVHEYFILIGLDYSFMLAKILVIAVGLSVNVVFRLDLPQVVFVPTARR